jgi:hypothetical protein
VDENTLLEKSMDYNTALHDLTLFTEKEMPLYADNAKPEDILGHYRKIDEAKRKLSILEKKLADICSFSRSQLEIVYFDLEKHRAEIASLGRKRGRQLREKHDKIVYDIIAGIIAGKDE